MFVIVFRNPVYPLFQFILSLPKDTLLLYEFY
jgi:hypothetical protein